jgi:hypothetical protein
MNNQLLEAITERDITIGTLKQIEAERKAFLTVVVPRYIKEIYGLRKIYRRFRIREILALFCIGRKTLPEDRKATKQLGKDIKRYRMDLAEAIVEDKLAYLAFRGWGVELFNKFNKHVQDLSFEHYCRHGHFPVGASRMKDRR